MIMFLLFAAIASMPPPPLEVPEVQVSIQPSSMDSIQLLRRQTPDTYTCEAAVFEAGTNHVYLVARLTALPGKTETVTKHAADYALEFTVKMTAIAAQTTVTVKRGDKMLTRQRSTVYLKPVLEDRNVPLH